MASTEPGAPPGAKTAAVGSVRHCARRRAGRQVHTRERSPPRSDAFETYYRAQCVVPAEEWDEFLSVLRTPLPVVVRLNRTKPCWQELQTSFASDPRWQSIPWWPQESVWQCAAENYDDALRTQCAQLNKAYALRFQEAASLVPPLLLGVQMGDLLLDLCAAPGSKTLECLELMREKSDADEGVVIANDADAERCFELLPLITRKARHPGTAVVLGSGSKFPVQLDSDGKQVLFDRIVCDVPCSGDGTLRKRPLGWSSWALEDGMKLHCKQLQILIRGLHLLRPGGTLVYSTCSMNPMENEAVVSAALARFQGDVSLQPDAAAALAAQGLDSQPGLGTWQVPHPTESGEFFGAWSAVPEELRRPKGIVAETMFASEGSTALPAGCIRLNPHRIDGSGFFVAVFAKSTHRATPASLPVGAPPPEAVLRLPWRVRNESNRYEVVAADAADVRGITDFYGLQQVPTPLLAEYNVKGRLTQLNLVNEALLKFLRCHLNCKGSPLLVSVGVPLFKLLDENFMTNLELPSRWRPALEGCALLAPHMSKRVLRLDTGPLKQLLATRLLPMAELQSLAASGLLSGLESCGDLLGSVVAGLRDDSFWTPCIITGRGLELYANSEELGEPVPVLLPRVRPLTLCEGPGYVALCKPTGLRTEDVLRMVQQTHPEAELVSRLDKQTSGCLLIASTRQGAAALTRQFAQGSVYKMYLALVWGQPEDTGQVDVPLALVENGGGNRYRAFVSDSGKPSLTCFRTLWRSADVALLALFPKTGRTHQIRCHMAHLGFPLVGDSKYGGPAALWCSRLPLHCLRMRALDEAGDALDAKAPLTEDFVGILEKLETEDKTVRCNSPEGWQGSLSELLNESLDEEHTEVTSPVALC